MTVDDDDDDDDDPPTHDDDPPKKHNATLFMYKTRFFSNSFSRAARYCVKTHLFLLFRFL